MSMRFTVVEPTAEMKAACEVCRDGWPLLISDDAKHAQHSLPEPVGGWCCYAGTELWQKALMERAA